MGKIDERTLRMKEEFMDLHRQGLSIKEIAEKFELSAPTVYTNLQEIADAAGVSREALLKSPHTQHAPFVRQNKLLIPVNREGFNSHYDAILVELGNLRGAIKEAVEEQEHLLNIG